MQSQMIGMQSSLDRILSAVQVQGQPAGQQVYASPVEPGSSRDGDPAYQQCPRLVYTADCHHRGFHIIARFPQLPGFAPPVREAVR